MAEPSTPLRPGPVFEAPPDVAGGGAHTPALSGVAAGHAVERDAHSHGHHPRLQHHFYTMDQQLEASTLGMWVFLVTEIMFFGGLFMAYVLYRYWYPDAWAAASNHLNVQMGAINTLVLIVSSLTMVLAVRSAQVGSFRGQITWLIGTILFGATFLVVKYFEYAEKFEHHLVPGAHFAPPADHIHAQHPAVGAAEQLFFSLYFIMTGIHAAHMVVGIAIMLVILAMAWKKRFSPGYYGPVEVSGLYWHFVDIVWIFLFPLLYLLGAHLGASH
jgi:cytochrome c oxidase subunit 3